MPVLKNPANPKPAAAAPKQAAAPKPAATIKPKTDPFGARLAEIEAKTGGGGFTPPPPGKYNALIVEGQGVIDGEKKSAYLEVIICDDENGALGMKCRVYWNFYDKEGKENEMGLAHFKGAFAMLGYETPTSWDAMCEDLADMANNNIWIVINVAKNAKGTNIYLDMVPEDQSQKPEMPQV